MSELDHDVEEFIRTMRSNIGYAIKTTERLAEDLEDMDDWCKQHLSCSPKEDQ